MIEFRVYANALSYGFDQKDSSWVSKFLLLLLSVQNIFQNVSYHRSNR